MTRWHHRVQQCTVRLAGIGREGLTVQEGMAQPHSNVEQGPGKGNDAHTQPAPSIHPYNPAAVPAHPPTVQVGVWLATRHREAYVPALQDPLPLAVESRSCLMQQESIGAGPRFRLQDAAAQVTAHQIHHCSCGMPRWSSTVFPTDSPVSVLRFCQRGAENSLMARARWAYEMGSQPQ